MYCLPPIKVVFSFSCFIYFLNVFVVIPRREATSVWLYNCVPSIFFIALLLIKYVTLL